MLVPLVESEPKIGVLAPIKSLVNQEACLAKVPHEELSCTQVPIGFFGADIATSGNVREDQIGPWHARPDYS